MKLTFVDTQHNWKKCISHCPGNTLHIFGLTWLISYQWHILHEMHWQSDRGSNFLDLRWLLIPFLLPELLVPVPPHSANSWNIIGHANFLRTHWKNYFWYLLVPCLLLVFFMEWNKIAFCFLLATGPTVKKSSFRELLGLSISISLIYFVNQGTFAVIQKEVVLFELDWV